MDNCKQFKARSGKQSIWRLGLGFSLAFFIIGGLPAQALILSASSLAADFPWVQANTNGFGSQTNAVNYSMAVFQNQLYAGVSNSSGAQLWRSPQGQSWSQVSTGWQSDPNNTHIFNMVNQWDEDLTISTYNAVTGGEVWQYDGYNWTQLNTDGFGDLNNIAVRSLIHASFPDKYYAGTYNVVSGTEIFNYQSGSWSQINTDGFGNRYNQLTTCMLLLEDYDLLVGTINSITGAEVWRRDGTNWSQVNSNGFGNVNNQAALSMGVFNDQQYVGTYNLDDGAEIWRYNEVSHGWQNVMAGGFGNIHNAGIPVLYAFGGYLYAGTANLIYGGQIWRTGNGTDWEPLMFGGFEHPNNLIIRSLVGYGHQLFAGTHNSSTGTEIWRSEPMGPDPSFQISSMPVDAAYPDGAYNPFAGEYLVAWENFNPGTENISAQRINADGQLVNPAFFVTTGSGAQRKFPQIAFDPDLQRFLVAWLQYESGVVSLRSQLISSTGSKIGGVNSLKSVSTSDWYLKLHQLVYSPVSDDYILLYTIHDDNYTENGVNVMTLNPDGQVAVDDIVVRPMASNNYLFSASLDWNHARNECLVAWGERDGDNENVYGRVVELATPDVRNAAFLISTGREAFNDDGPSVAAMGGQPPYAGTYLVSWISYDKNAATYDMDYAIYGRKVDGNGAFLGPTFPVSDQVAHQSCSLNAANESAGVFFTGYITDYDDYSVFPFIHGRFLPEYAEAVSGELWLGMREKGYGCALPVSGSPGDFLVLTSSLAPGDSSSQIRGTLVGYRLQIYLPFVSR